VHALLYSPPSEAPRPRPTTNTLAGAARRPMPYELTTKTKNHLAATRQVCVTSGHHKHQPVPSIASLFLHSMVDCRRSSSSIRRQARQAAKRKKSKERRREHAGRHQCSKSTTHSTRHAAARRTGHLGTLFTDKHKWKELTGGGRGTQDSQRSPPGVRSHTSNPPGWGWAGPPATGPATVPTSISNTRRRID
jgi:hypothetical protein